MSDQTEAWPGQLPDWPEDTADHVFIAREFSEIEIAYGAEAENVAVKALGDGTLKVGLRFFDDSVAKYATLNRPLTPETWRMCLQRSYFMTRDIRPWVHVSRRRAIPQPHWIFVTRESLKGFVDLAPPFVSYERYREDAALILEALEGLKEKRWARRYQAAKALAGRAQGASEDAIVRRLERKIKDAQDREATQPP